MMSMALATGASGVAFAKGGGKAAGDVPLLLGSGVQMAVLPDEAAGHARQSALRGAMQNLMGHGPNPHGKGWHLEMLSPDAGPAQDFAVRPAKRLGVALRMAF